MHSIETVDFLNFSATSCPLVQNILLPHFLTLYWDSSSILSNGYWGSYHGSKAARASS